MAQKSVIGTVIKDQIKELDLLEDLVQRSIFQEAASYKGTSAFVIKGLRRCGKSTLLKQIIDAKFKDRFFYFNFDDERIGSFKADDFQKLMETAIELFGKKENLFFDEIQNIKGWELFINRMLREGHTIFITGSNANLLSKELGTHLTGRHTDIELYPFSFIEFLKSKGIDITKNSVYSTEEKAEFSKSFKEYLEMGGMPETVVFSNDTILSQLLSDIIQKDIVCRYNVRKIAELKAVIKFLIANAANQITYRSIAKNFDIKSSNTVQKYAQYAEETYLVFSVKKYGSKLKKFDKNPKKIYCADNGIILKNTPNINERKGALLENLVAVHLKRLGKELYYYRDEKNKECDFILPKEKQAIQVCYNLNDENREREIGGLLGAMNRIKGTRGLILTLEQEEEIERKGSKISIKPAWQWLIENE